MNLDIKLYNEYLNGEKEVLKFLHNKLYFFIFNILQNCHKIFKNKNILMFVANENVDSSILEAKPYSEYTKKDVVYNAQKEIRNIYSKENQK